MGAHRFALATLLLACMATASAMMLTQRGPGITTTRNGYIVRGSKWSYSLDRRMNYTLYVPNTSYKMRVPLIVFLQDVWTTPDDDLEVFDVADAWVSETRGKQAFAVLRPEGNLALLPNNVRTGQPTPWVTPDVPSFWVKSPAGGDMQRAVVELVMELRKGHGYSGPFSIVGHGVGGWGARVIAWRYAPAFTAVGSLNGVTDYSCFREFAARANKLYRVADLLESSAARVGDDLLLKMRLLWTCDYADVSSLEAFNRTFVELLRSKQRTPLTDVAETELAEPLSGRFAGRLYIQVGKGDEFGLYNCNEALHAALLKANVQHSFVVTYVGRDCSFCERSAEYPDRCADHVELKACGTHRPDGPAFLKSTIRLPTARDPLWSGGIGSAFRGFAEFAMDKAYPSKRGV